MNIPHEVEELILAFVGLKRKKRCIAQTKSNKICSRRTGNWILCTQHMKLVNLCIVIHRAMQHSDAYRRRKERRNRTKGKTYYPNAHINRIILR